MARNVEVRKEVLEAFQELLERTDLHKEDDTDDIPWASLYEEIHKVLHSEK